MGVKIVLLVAITQSFLKGIDSGFCILLLHGLSTANSDHFGSEEMKKLMWVGVVSLILAILSFLLAGFLALTTVTNVYDGHKLVILKTWLALAIFDLVSTILHMVFVGETLAQFVASTINLVIIILSIISVLFFIVPINARVQQKLLFDDICRITRNPSLDTTIANSPGSLVQHKINEIKALLLV